MKKNTSIKLKNKILFLLLLSVVSAHAQTKEMRQLLHQTITIDEAHIKIRAHILAEHHEIKVKDNRVYYWFQSGKINHTRGGYSGKVLEGEYTEFFNDNNLKTQGEFHVGLKNKEWKHWYPNGEHQKTETWKHGVLEGDFKEYNQKGELTRSGSYKNDLLHGKIVLYTNGVLEKTIYYKQGIEVTKEELEKAEKQAAKDAKKSPEKIERQAAKAAEKEEKKPKEKKEEKIADKKPK